MPNGPSLPYMLGLSGLLPFVLLASLVATFEGVPAGIAAMLLMLYGAVILSFLGGTRWAAAIAKNPDQPHALTLVISMTPPLWAWAAIITTLFAAPALGAVMLAAGLALHWVWDWKAVKAKEFPNWYLPLRTVLTTIACLSILIAAASYPANLPG
jgi:hypothetical protein